MFHWYCKVIYNLRQIFSPIQLIIWLCLVQFGFEKGNQNLM